MMMGGQEERAVELMGYLLESLWTPIGLGWREAKGGRLAERRVLATGWGIGGTCVEHKAFFCCCCC